MKPVILLVLTNLLFAGCTSRGFQSFNLRGSEIVGDIRIVHNAPNLGSKIDGPVREYFPALNTHVIRSQQPHQLYLRIAPAKKVGTNWALNVHLEKNYADKIPTRDPDLIISNQFRTVDQHYQIPWVRVNNSAYFLGAVFNGINNADSMEVITQRYELGYTEKITFYGSGFSTEFIIETALEYKQLVQ